MTAFTLRLPQSLQNEIKLLAKLEGISMNQLLTIAAAEKVSALRTIDHLRKEGELGSRADYDAFLNSVPDVEPDEEDQIN